MRSQTKYLLLALSAPAHLGAQDPRQTSVGGYGEIHYANPSGPAPGRANVARFVLYFGHTFSDRLSFHSELELEDAKIEGGEPGGEVALEQAYLNYRLGNRLALRAGLLLVPIGIMNESHEPPTFHGVARPLYDRVIIPTTWRDIGVGVAGTIPGVDALGFRAYVINGLEASGFSAENGIRGGRQEGADASFANAAVVGRLEYGRPGLKIGAAAYHAGTAGAEFGLGSGAFAAPVTILAADVRAGAGPFSLRAEAARICVARADEINQVFGTDAAARIGGWYAEGAYDVIHALGGGTRPTLAAFVRHERLDTEASLPQGRSADGTLARRITTFGLTFKPVPDVALKGDYQLRRNRAGTGQDQVLSLGIGYQF